MQQHFYLPTQLCPAFLEMMLKATILAENNKYGLRLFQILILWLPMGCYQLIAYLFEKAKIMFKKTINIYLRDTQCVDINSLVLTKKIIIRWD